MSSNTMGFDGASLAMIGVSTDFLLFQTNNKFLMTTNSFSDCLKFSMIKTILKTKVFTSVSDHVPTVDDGNITALVLLDYSKTF